MRGTKPILLYGEISNEFHFISPFEEEDFIGEIRIISDNESTLVKKMKGKIYIRDFPVKLGTFFEN